MQHNRQSICAIILLLGFTMTGCGLFNSPPQIDLLKPLLHAATGLVTVRILQKNPRAAPLLVDLTRTLITYFDTGQYTTPASLKALIVIQLNKLELDPELRIVVNTLVTGLSEALGAIIRERNIPDSEAKILIGEVLLWVQEVALRYVTIPAIGLIGPRYNK